MDNPIYIPSFIDGSPEVLEKLLTTIPWLDRTETRRECFMSNGGGISYTYGSGRGVRDYTSIDYDPYVLTVLGEVNRVLSSYNWGGMNGVFLNCYLHEKNHLGWHADNFTSMDHSYPVVSVSFGEPRQIWWRPIGDTGETPEDRKQLLASGSMFIMPPGFQFTHEHRIPKGDRMMTPRVSMTFRRFLE